VADERKPGVLARRDDEADRPLERTVADEERVPAWRQIDSDAVAEREGVIRAAIDASVHMSPPPRILGMIAANRHDAPSGPR